MCPLDGALRPCKQAPCQRLSYWNTSFVLCN